MRSQQETEEVDVRAPSEQRINQKPRDGICFLTVSFWELDSSWFEWYLMIMSCYCLGFLVESQNFELWKSWTMQRNELYAAEHCWGPRRADGVVPNWKSGEQVKITLDEFLLLTGNLMWLVFLKAVELPIFMQADQSPCLILFLLTMPSRKTFRMSSTCKVANLLCQFLRRPSHWSQDIGEGFCSTTVDNWDWRKHRKSKVLSKPISKINRL